ncbi:MAG: HAD-IIIA family hydrolase [Myxococcales bacterium]|nr:HAD-IIIA family hydrolase [Myxococcales bacterium]
MSLSPAARRIAEAEARARLSARKAALGALLDRICGVLDPPISNGELSVGLELPVTEIGRYRSPTTRLRAALPDRFVQAVLDGLGAGSLLLGVLDDPRSSRRTLQVCTPEEAARLGKEWALFNVAGGPVPERVASWDEDDAWDLFGEGRRVMVAAPRVMEAGLLRAAVRVGPADDALVLSALGLGAMRLSTGGRPDAATARAVIGAALDAGVRFIDTADVYAEDEDDLHHNERLIAAALAERPERGAVVVATKAGLRRRGERWLPCGEPDHIRAAVERSRAALGVARIDLVQLHAVDPRVPIEASVAALAELQQAGAVRHIGLCNVDAAQVAAARAVAPIVSVQNAWSLLDRTAWTRGVIEVCRAHGIALIAHSPLGGHKRRGRLAKDVALAAIAEAHGVSAEAVALAYLMDGGLIPIPGATRPESAAASAAALSLRLSDAERATLDARFPEAVAERPVVFSGGAAPEVVVVMGPPAAGKSSRVQPLVDEGYTRLNRDLLGGKLDDLVPHFTRAFDGGHRRFVLDNTYPTRQSRAGLIAAARERGLPVRCLWIDADADAVRFNAARRIYTKYGRMLEPEEIAAAGKDDPNTFPPIVISSWFKRFEPPSTEEGFVSVTRAPFRRVLGPAYVNRALICDYDGTLRATRSGEIFPRSPADVVALPGRAAVLRRFREAGWHLLGVSNQGGVAAGMLTYEAAFAGLEETHRQLELRLDVRMCPHPARPVKCWCRKPLPGFAVELIERYRLDPARCIFVGDLRSDREFAEAAGFRYADAEPFFADPPVP